MSLVFSTDNPAPERIEEITLGGRGGIRLRGFFAPTTTQRRGTMLIAPGRTEMVEKYFETAIDLQERGFDVCAVDIRGQGGADRLPSDPAGGHMDSFDHAAQDFASIASSLPQLVQGPIYTLAHSMGGMIVLRAMQRRWIEPKAAIFCAPLWGLDFPGASRFAIPLAHFLASFGVGHLHVPLPKVVETAEDNPVTCSAGRFRRNAAILAANPALGIGGPTFGWVAHALDTMRALQRPGALDHLRTPVLALTAQRESIVSPTGQLTVIDNLPLVTHVRIDDAKHEILQETDTVRTRALAAIDQFLSGV